MSLYVTPQVIALTPGATSSFVLTSTLGDLTTPTFTPGVSGQVTFAKTSGDAKVQTWSITASADAYATFPVTITDTVSGNTIPLNVSIVPAVPAVPNGYTPLSFISQVQGRTNEPNEPSNQQIIDFANAGLQEIVTQLGTIRQAQTYYTTNSQTIQALTADVQDIISCSWSTGPVTAPGSLVYPMAPMDQGMFMDFSAGFPAVGFGPPTAFFLFQDAAGTMIMQLYPAAMQGQLNVYAKTRPILWTLTDNGTANGTSTNLDTSMQEADVLWTCARVLENRGRAGEAYAQGGFAQQFREKMEQLKSDSNRRVSPKFGQVRDLVGRNYPSPWGWW